MIVYDDMEPTEKIKLYDKGISMNHDPQDRARLLAGYRNGDMLVPNVDTSEALRLMVSDFIHAIIEGAVPVSDGYSGYRVVRLLQLAQKSMALNGRAVEVEPLLISAPGENGGPFKPRWPAAQLAAPSLEIVEFPGREKQLAQGV